MIEDQPPESSQDSTFRVRLVGGPFDGDLIDAQLVNGSFFMRYVCPIDEVHAALYQPPLNFNPAHVVEFAFDGHVRWDDSERKR